MVRELPSQSELDYTAYQEKVGRWLILKRSMDRKSVIVLSVFISFLSVAAGQTMFQLLVYPARAYEQYGLYAILAPLMLTALWTLFVWVVFRNQTTTRQHYLFGKFAVQNGFTYDQRSKSFTLPGMLFRSGNQIAKRWTNDVMTGTYMGQEFILGNQHYENFAMGRVNTFDYGFLAVQISRQLPQILLRSRSKAMEFTAGFKAEQVLELEGDFGKYFTLFCPKGYEQDALYVLTPDLMMLLIDYGAQYDIEIDKNYVFFYHRPFVFDEEETRGLFSIIATLGSAVSTRTKRYRDQMSWRSGTSSRLRQGIWGVVLVYIIILVLTLLRFLLR